MKLLYAQYRELQAFSQFGSDLDEDTKKRLALGERIVEVLKQKRNAPVRVGCQVAIVYAVINGYLNDVPVKKWRNTRKNCLRIWKMSIAICWNDLRIISVTMQTFLC